MNKAWRKSALPWYSSWTHKHARPNRTKSPRPAPDPLPLRVRSTGPWESMHSYLWWCFSFIVSHNSQCFYHYTPHGQKYTYTLHLCTIPLCKMQNYHKGLTLQTRTSLNNQAMVLKLIVQQSNMGVMYFGLVSRLFCCFHCFCWDVYAVNALTSINSSCNIYSLQTVMCCTSTGNAIH